MKTTALLLLFVGCALAQDNLVWSDEFDALDEDAWQHMVTAWRGGNHEFQYYRNDRNNSFVRDGVLYIKPTLTADEYGEDFLYNGVLNLWEEGCTQDFNIDGGCYIYANGDYIINPIQSARMLSTPSFSFKYGRVEIRAQMPRGDWLWPAIWMLPQSDVYGGWPQSGEIDIVESTGNVDLTCDGSLSGHQVMGSTLHWGPDYFNNRWYLTHAERTDIDNPFGDDFHLFGIEWTEESLTYLVDGIEIGSVNPPEGGFWELGGFSGDNLWADGNKMAPFDQEFHFVLNVAAGGNYFSDSCVNAFGDKPWYGQYVPGAMKSFWEAKEDWQATWVEDDVAMKIDYIRVYQ